MTDSIEMTEPTETREMTAADVSVADLSNRDLGLLIVDRFGAAALGGVFAGFLIGGVGGRLAMFILRLTSDPSVVGIQSDDDFTIGQFTSSTIFLVVLTTVVGTVLAFGYLLVRRWLPAAHRPLQAALFFGLLGGAAVIKPDGVDFTRLDPQALAVALFIALPTAYGWVMAAIVEWLIDHPGRLRKARVAGAILFLVVGVLGTIPALIAIVGGLMVLAARRWPAMVSLARHPVVTWAVRLVLVAIAGLSAAALFSDVSEIL